MRVFLAQDGAVAALRPGDPEAAAVGIIPGDDVALHRVWLSGGNARERRAEARMRASDLAAQPLDDLHLALAPAGDAGDWWLALIGRERMAAHLAAFAAAGVDPDHVVPAPLLLPAADSGVSAARLGDLCLLRGNDFAASVEPELAALLAPGTAPGAFTPEMTAPPPLDLRQGEFARRLRWWRLRWVQVAVAMLVLVALLLAALPAAMAHVRSRAAAAAEDQRIRDLAGHVLGRPFADADAAARALSAARRRAEGSAVAPRLSLATALLAAAAPARLDRVELAPDGTLQLTLGGPAEAAGRAAAAFRDQRWFAAAVDGPVVRLGPRRVPETRAGAAAADAAIVSAARRARSGQADARPGADPVATALAAAGLLDAASVGREGAGTMITIPAARSQVLLPMLVDLEAAGMPIVALRLEAAADGTIGGRVEVRR